MGSHRRFQLGSPGILNTEPDLQTPISGTKTSLLPERNPEQDQVRGWGWGGWADGRSCIQGGQLDQPAVFLRNFYFFVFFFIKGEALEIWPIERWRTHYLFKCQRQRRPPACMLIAAARGASWSLKTSDSDAAKSPEFLTQQCPAAPLLTTGCEGHIYTLKTKTDAKQKLGLKKKKSITVIGGENAKLRLWMHLCPAFWGWG